MGIGLGIPLAVCLGAIVAFLVLRALRKRDAHIPQQGNGIEDPDGFGGVDQVQEVEVKGNGGKDMIRADKGPYVDASGELSEYLGPHRENVVR